MLLKTLYWSVALLICTSTWLMGQQEKMRLRSPEVVFAMAPLDTAFNLRQQPSPYFLVRLKAGEKRFALKDNNVEIIRWLHDGYAIIESNNGVRQGHHAMFQTILHANNLWKLSDDLLEKHEIQTDERLDFTVRVSDKALESVMHALSAVRELKLIKTHQSTLIIQCTLQSITQHVLPVHDVLYVGVESYTPTVESRVLDLNLEPNAVNRVHHEYPDLNGEGLTLSVKELAYNPDDMDIDGRHVSSTLTSPLIDPHATEMATIAAGAGNSFVTGRGVAKAARLTSSDFINLFPDSDGDYLLLDAWIQNHSYGTVIENFYGSLAESFDQNTNRNPELLHVFSSGNKGNETSVTGNYLGIPGVANLTGNFKMAKNALVVGSVDTVGREVFFSSRGPAFDGRIKPELVAYSTAGSSNSAALVSGVALLLQQVYKEAEGELPSSALLKALLINSAQDAGVPGIDFVTGYGNVDSYRSVQNLLAGRYFEGSVSQGETDNILLAIPSNAKNLKVTLVWNDPAAQVNSNNVLVNDLDVVLIDPASSTWNPWTLNASPNISSLTLPAIRSADHINNVEQVTMENAPSGNYTIYITGFDVPQSPQQYYVAYQWDTLNQFDWSFPTGSDNMPYNGESAGYFRWKSTLTEESGQLEYSIDNGDTWQIIQNNVDLSKGYLRWLPPEITASAIARMVVGSETYLTDRFAISRPIPVQVGFNCTDSVMLQWNQVTGAQAYEVFTFNENYLESIEITADTSFIMQKSEFPSRLYAVQPILLDGAVTIRSYTFDYAQQGVGCFIRNFNSEVPGAQGILLTLQLGTLYGVEQIFFERKNNEGIFEIIESVSAGSNPVFQYLDSQPHQGYNYHRTRIQLQNGEEVVTEIAENFFLTETPYVVFPNPVPRYEGLYVFSDLFQSTNAVFRLYRTDGQLILAQELLSDREAIDLTDVHAGLYFYAIENNNRFYNGKILVIDQ